MDRHRTASQQLSSVLLHGGSMGRGSHAAPNDRPSYCPGTILRNVIVHLFNTLSREFPQKFRKPSRKSPRVRPFQETAVTKTRSGIPDRYYVYSRIWLRRARPSGPNPRSNSRLIAPGPRPALPQDPIRLRGSARIQLSFADQARRLAAWAERNVNPNTYRIHLRRHCRFNRCMHALVGPLTRSALEMARARRACSLVAGWRRGPAE